MASWDKIQREVMLKANQLNAADASTLASIYSVTSIGQTELNDRAIEFPFSAINDSILDACGKIVGVIGFNPNSPYRSYFHDTTDSISDGGRIPEYSQAGHPRVGVIGAVYDSSNSRECERVARQQVDGADALSLKISPYLFNSDGVRIWHTRTSVVADIVVWEAQVERYWMESAVRGECPFPDSLNGTIVSGALHYLFRSKFNNEQAEQWGVRFSDDLERLK
jgi:hypothetical protein